jgi:Domain of unknown function (DUF4124)
MYTVFLRLLLALAALATACPATAQIYKWVDENGHVYYGDRPEADSTSLQIPVDDDTAVAPANDVLTREEKRRRLLESMQEDRYEKSERRAKEKAERERERRLCNQYRDRQRLYESAGRLYNLDRDGNRIYMSIDERDKSTRELQRNINKHCH